MGQACTACQETAPEASRLKAAALLVGAIVFCPCHLPITIAALATVGGAAWLVGNPALLYLVFGITYLFVIAFGLRYLSQRRDQQRELEAVHERSHSSIVPTPSSIPAA